LKISLINKTSQKKWSAYRRYIPMISQSIKSKMDINPNYAVSVFLIDDVEMQSLNLQYRKIDATTDVITFAYLEYQQEHLTLQQQLYIGDIFINVDALTRQSNEFGHSLKREFSFLLVHGILHALGYDHIDTDDEDKMFSLQKEILYGIAHRYAQTVS